MDTTVRIATAASGIAAFVITLPVIALYFVTSDPPPTRNVLTRVLLNVVLCAALLSFIAGYSALVYSASRDYAWLATLTLAAGVALVVVTLVADAVQAGAVLHAGTNIDPTRMGSGGEASQVIYGPIARVLTALVLIAAAGGTLVTGLAPAWMGWLALAVAVFHLGLAPTILSATDPSRFYSLNGWSIPIAGGLFLTWVLTVSIAILRS